MQPWEVTITRSVKPILRAGIGLWTLLLLAISLGLLEA